MTLLKKPLIFLVSLASTVYLLGTTSKLTPRSQSVNTARQMVGWNNPEWGINRLPQDSWYTSFNLTFAYTRTFRDPRISYSLFGNDIVCTCDGNETISISGSDVSDRKRTDWLADYFGLPRDFKSTVAFIPLIDNFILDFSVYMGFDAWIEGLYFRIHGPYVNTRWNLNAKETIIQAGTTGYFQGYFSSVVVPVENLNKKFLDYANGCTPNIDNNYTEYNETVCTASGYCNPLGDITWNSLCCSRINNICKDALTANGFAELRFVLGYNVINQEHGDYHLGAGIYAAAPTGTRIGDDTCNGRYLFEPIVGNGKHWELGAQITAHHIWWRDEDENKSFGIYMETNITHLFGACQTRCFDLCSAGSNSRYMLAERLDSALSTFPTIPAPYNPLNVQFANEYTPVANLTRRSVTSSFGAQGDFSLSLAYQVGGLQWDVGYNFWGRSCEQLCLKNDCCYDATLNTWALKGDQRVYGFANYLAGTDSFAFKLPVTDSNATIHGGSNMNNGVSYTGPNPLEPRNFYADNSVLIDPIAVTLPDGTIQIYTSQTPIFIQESDFNLTGTRGISNKLFTHFNWAWAERPERVWIPYLGMGAEVEFGSHARRCCKPTCNTPVSCNTSLCSPAAPTCCPTQNCCENCAISQWGMWLKLGASYN